MTGSITAYINEVGMKPLRMSDYDKAVLAVRDGEIRAELPPPDMPLSTSSDSMWKS